MSELDEFLKEMHGTTEAAEASGAPTIGDLKERFKTKSAIIRHLHGDKGMPVKEIAKLLGLKYQHVRNVVFQKLKRGPNEDFHLGEGQAAAIVRDYREFGQKTNGEQNDHAIDSDEED
jgi:DNA-binding transcriptional MerR regulator